MTTWYWDNAASADNGTGASNSPWKLLATHASSVAAGDEIVVVGASTVASPQVYSESINIQNTTSWPSGTPASPIIIRAASNQYVLFQPSSSPTFYFRGVSDWIVDGYDRNYHLKFDSGSRASNGYAIRLRDGSNLQVRLAEVYNGRYYTMIEWRNCPHWKAASLLLYDNYIGASADAAGVLVQGDAASLVGGSYIACVSACLGSDGFVQDLPTTGCALWADLVVRDNQGTSWSGCPGKSENHIDLKAASNAEVYNNISDGWRYNDGSVSGTGGGGSTAITAHSYSRNNKFHDNEFYDCSGGGLVMTAPGASVYNNLFRDFVYEAALASNERAMVKFSSASGSVAYCDNNTFVGRHGASPIGNLMRVYDGVTVYFRNNVAASTGDLVNGVNTTINASYNCWQSACWSKSGTGDKSGDPGFYNPSASDYRLAASSICAAAGLDLGYRSYSGSTVSIGAFEPVSADGGGGAVGVYAYMFYQNMIAG